MENPCEFVNGRQFANIVGCHPTAVPRVAALNGVRMLAIPGCRTKYHRGDVEALVVVAPAGDQHRAAAS